MRTEGYLPVAVALPGTAPRGWRGRRPLRLNTAATGVGFLVSIQSGEAGGGLFSSLARSPITCDYASQISSARGSLAIGLEVEVAMGYSSNALFTIIFNF